MSGSRDDDIEVDKDGNAWLTIGGLRAQIVSDEEAEAVDFVVCGNHSYFPDDVKTTCATCQRPIVHRPSAPALPPKLCIACATARAKESDHA